MISVGIYYTLTCSQATPSPGKRSSPSAHEASCCLFQASVDSPVPSKQPAFIYELGD